MATSRLPFARGAWAGRVILASLFVLLACFASNARAQTVVSLTFDDGIASQLDAASVLEAHGMHGTFFINSGNVASKAYFMTWPQLDGLAAKGHEIAGHTIDHKRLTDLTPDAQRSEICDDAATLRAHGYTITDFAYPFGAGSTQPAVLSALQDCGYVSARKVGELNSDSGCGPTCPSAETLPPGNKYGIRATPLPTGPISLANLESWVTAAESSGTGWLPIIFHDICDGCNDDSVTASDFSAFIDWLAARAPQGTVVKTVRQALAEGPQFPPPATAISCNGTSCAGSVFKSPVSLAFSVTDSGGGVGATRYTLDGTDPTPSSPAYTAPFTIGTTTTVKFRSWDLTGNPEPVRTQVVNVDGTPPTVQISSPSNGASLLQGPLSVSVDASDVGSSVKDVQLFVDGDYFGSASGSTSPYTFTVPASTMTLGTHRLKALAIDAAGNQTSTAVFTITIKDGLPTTTIACDGGTCPTGFVKGPVSVSLAAADGGAGLGATRYTLDGTDPSTSSTAYTAPFSLTDSATVKFRTWDASGNPEPVRNQALKIDAIAPTAQIVSPTDGMSLLLRNDVTVQVNAADAGVGIDDVQLFVDGDYYDYSRSTGTPYQFTLPSGTLALGSHRLKAIATDKLGNRASTSVINVTVKDGLPTTTIACDGGACPTGFVKGPVSVSLAATDGGAGVGATRYTLDGTDPSTSSTAYTAPFSLTDSATVKFRSWDAAGNPEPVRTQALKIDGAAPLTQIALPADGGSLLARNPVHVSVDATDAGSGIEDVQLFVDGDYYDYSRSTGTPYQFDLPVGKLGLGNHRLKAIATDKLGNAASSLVNVTIKDGLPVTTIACDGGACPTGFVKGPVSVTLSATDGGAGIGATRYTLDGSDPTASSSAYTGPITLADTTTVKFRSWDSDGNPESVRSQTVKVDAVSPVAQIASPTDGASIVQGPVTVKVDASDAGSGIADVQLFVDGDYYDYSRSTGTPYQFDLPADKLALGNHRLKALVTDKMGNSTSTPVANVTVKDGLPTTTIACDGGACPTGFVKGPVSVSLNAADGGAGVGATRYTLDGTDPTAGSTAYTAPVSLTDSATVKFRSWDSSGHPEAVHTQDLKIDATGPIAQIGSPADGGVALQRNDLNVHVDASDAGSGVAEVQLFLDGNYTASVKSAPYDFTLAAGTLSVGTHRLKALVTDALGNATNTATNTVTVADGLPVTTIACDGGACPTGFVKGPVSVSLNAADGGAGVGATRYTLDGSDPTPASPAYTAPFTITDTTTVKFRSWDLAGNPEQVQTKTLQLDAIAPTAQIDSPADGSNLLTRDDATVKVGASDTGSGVADVQLFVDGNYTASVKSAPYDFTLSAGTLSPGSHRLKALVTDGIGNSTSSDVVNVTLRDGLPTTTIACDGGACPTGFVKGPVSVSLAATDGGAGLGATRYTLDGSDPTGTSAQYTTPFTLTDSATVKFRTWDAAGNPEQVRSQVLKIDAVAPTAQISAPADGASVLQRDDVTVKVDASDATGSGVADVQLFVDGNYTASVKSAPYDFRLPAGTLSLGTHRLKALVADALGNSASSAVSNLTVNDGLPATTIACDGGACPTGFVKGPVSVSLAATDGGAGLGATRYTLDGSDPSTSSPAYTAPFTLTDTTTVKFRSWDAAGNAEPVRTQALKIDAVAPTAQISSPADGSTITMRDITVDVEAADAGSGIHDVQLFVDGNYAGTSSSLSSPYEFKLAAGTLALGSHKLKALVTDALGNSTQTAVVNFTLVDGLPTTTLACDGGTCPANFVKGPVSVSLSATDGGNGIGATRYTLDGSDPTTTSTLYTGPFPISDLTTVKFRSWDSLGNAEQVRSQTIKADSVAPVSHVTAPADGTTMLMGDFTLSADVSDTGSGVSEVELFADGDYLDWARSKTSPYQFTVKAGTLAVGTHSLKVIATDAFGNHASSAPITVKLTDGMPQTSIACNGAACPAGFVEGPESVSLSAADAGGGVAATRYTLDGSDPTPSSPAYSGPFTLTNTTTVKFRSWDLAGNAEPVRTQAVKIDSSPPTAQIVSPADAASLLKGEVKVKVDAADTGSGVTDVELYVDGDYVDYSRSQASPYEFTLPAGSLALGSHRIKAYVEDALGHHVWTAPVTFKVVDGLPETTIACNGAACTNDWSKGPVSVSLSAADGGGGLAATRYTLDGSDPDTSSPQYNGPFTLTDTTAVKFRTWDQAGNVEPVRSQTIQLDHTAPTAQIASPADASSVQPGDVSVKVDGADVGSGITDAELYLDGDYVDYSRSKASPYEFTLPAGKLSAGSHTIKAYVEDAVGNHAWSTPVTFKAETGLPATTISCDGKACTNDWSKGPVTVALAAIDAGSGLGATRYTLDGSDPDTGSAQYTAPFSLAGTTTVKFRTWDANGNAEPVQSQTIKIDSTPPTVQITSPAEGDHVTGNVTVKADAADAGAGATDVALFVDGDYLASSTNGASPFDVPWNTDLFTPGTHTIKVVAEDDLGNRAASSPVTVTVDAPPAPPGPPTTTISCDGLGCPSGFVKGPVNVTLAAIDGGKGVGATRYTLDGSTPDTSSTEYTGPFTVSDTTTVKFRSWDADGNAEQVRSQDIKIDTTAPTAHLVSPADGANVSGDIVVRVDAADTGAGVSDVELYVDGDYVTTSTSTVSPYDITIPAGALAPGTHDLKVTVADTLGNIVGTDPITITVG